MSSEYELILLLLGCASRDRKEQELQGEVDWERLWGVAEEEGLALPLWECLDREFAAYLPEPTAELMSSSATWRTLAQIRQVNELLALLDLPLPRDRGSVLQGAGAGFPCLWRRFGTRVGRSGSLGCTGDVRRSVSASQGRRVCARTRRPASLLSQVGLRDHTYS